MRIPAAICALLGLLSTLSAWGQKGSSPLSIGQSRPDLSQELMPATTERVPQVEVDWVLVRFDAEKLVKHPEFRAAGGLHSALIAGLFAEGAGRVLDAVKLSVLDGEDAVARSVDELPFPTEFDDLENDIEVRGPGTNQVVGTVLPGAFEVREIGTVVRVRPFVREGLATVSLSLAVERVTRSGWADYRTLPEGASTPVAVAATALPVFRSHSLETRMRLALDTPTVAGMQVSADDGAWLVHLVTVRLHWIDPEDSPADAGPSQPGGKP
jgi:hypothetical protein